MKADIQAIEARKNEQKTAVVEQLGKTPIVQLVCEKIGVSRATYYRWRKEDQSFANSCDLAMADGINLVSDMAESKLIGGIKNENHNSISFWLKHRHPAYAEKLHIQAKIEPESPLSPDQEELVRRALIQIAGGTPAPNRDPNG
jgi:hypothetical protein